MVRGAVAYAMITTIGVMIVTSLAVGVANAEQGTPDQLLVSPHHRQIFVSKAVPALIVATLRATIIARRVGIWAYQIPVCRLAGAVLILRW